MITVKQQQIHEIYKYAVAGIGGHLFATFILFYILYGNVEITHLNTWASTALAVLALRGLSVFIYKHTEQTKNSNFNTNKWIFIYQVGVFSTAVIWILAPFIFSEQYKIADLNLIIIGISFGLAGAGVTTIGSVFRIYVPFVTPIFIGISYILFTTNKANYFELGFLAIFGLLFMLFGSYNHSKRTYMLIEKTDEAERSKIEIIDRLGKAGEFRDNETGKHVQRMSYSSYLLAIESGLSPKNAEQILLASKMHDIGKIGITDNILLKPGKLTSQEFETMKTHTTIGSKILSSNNSTLLKLAGVIAENHHEKWDGSGYPKGLIGDSIPIEARIVSICDVFDALISVRPYKKAWPIEDALSFIRDESGKYFDPNLVNCFITISDQVIEYTNKNQDSTPESV